MEDNKEIKETKEVTPTVDDIALVKAVDDFLTSAKSEDTDQSDEVQVNEDPDEKIEKADKKDKPGDEDATRGGKDLKKMKKQEDEEEDEEEDDEEEDDEEKKKKMQLEKKCKIKKSLEVDEDEYSEFLSWKEDQDKLDKAKEKEELIEDLKKAVMSDTEDVREQFIAVGTILKSLNEKVDRLGDLPARGRKSFDNVQAIEKATKEDNDLQKSENGENTDKLSKAKILQELTQLCRAGLIEVEDVTIFERTEKITPHAAKAVENLKKDK